jgi:chromosome partitioning protein
MAPKQPARLRVVTLASTKGGVGKTTLASALAVRATDESRRVALLDLDPQESLASWWTRRGKVKNPKLFEVDATAEAIGLLVSEGWQWVFIDTGPARIELIEPGIAVADFVLIPTRPSALNIEQAAITVELCETPGKPHGFVFNHAPAGTKLTKSSIQFLKQNGSLVIDAPISEELLHGRPEGVDFLPRRSILLHLRSGFTHRHGGHVGGMVGKRLMSFRLEKHFGRPHRMASGLAAALK